MPENQLIRSTFVNATHWSIRTLLNLSWLMSHEGHLKVRLVGERKEKLSDTDSAMNTSEPTPNT